MRGSAWWSATATSQRERFSPGPAGWRSRSRVFETTHERRRAASDSPPVLPPYLRRSKSIDELIPWLYLKGISTGDFTEALQSLVGEDAPRFRRTLSCDSPTVEPGIRRVESPRPLRKTVRVRLGGWHPRERSPGKRGQSAAVLLVLMGATADGLKELIAVVDGYRESEQSWYELLLDLKSRGLALAPKLAIGDGALGFWAALRKVFGETREQRCWLHKTGMC
ncbi:MAG: transposase [Pirellulales bacterium]